MMASIKFRSREEAIIAMLPSADATTLSEFLLAFEENLQGPEKKVRERKRKKRLS